jgi:glycerol-3-phosphate dehydrogenase (NAD(P)+)
MAAASNDGKAAILGGGSWGTALAQLMARKGFRVTMWAREEEVVDGINSHGENKVFLPGIELDPNLRATTRVRKALDGADIVLFVIPTQFLRGFLVRNREDFPPNVPLVCCAKGIENTSLMMPFEVMRDELPGKYHHWLAVLSGPSFAREVAQRMPTNVTVAAQSPEVAAQVQEMVRELYFRVYTSDDVMGVEMGGATKNVLAIATGVGDGMGLGDNARAAIITRGLAEITRLAVKKGANPLTLAGLAGMGDLVLTCAGELSRNRQVGLRLAKGETIEQIRKSMRMVAEGVPTAKSVYHLSRKLGVEMPICDQVYYVLYDSKPVQDGLNSLLERPVGREIRGQ